ncbi:trypsin-like serine peptidase [Streptomyces sp. KLOTTS4A1]|uniref:trypsin-like serine peptidase n=1 Tax=Streptomyces sp. KLOTTS4A1 TaxID=3390996 RepID=UPI0039F47EAF
MRSTRPTALRLAAAGLVSALALTACNSGDDPKAADKPSASQGSGQGSDKGSDELPEIPAELTDRLKKHGIDLDEWKQGGWKDWDKETWLREAKDFVNPVIEGLWKPERMAKAEDPVQTIDTKAASGSDAGVTDPQPRPVQAVEEDKPYWKHAAPVGKIFFDTPEGSAVCSGTIVKDPGNPGKSNLVWTAGHCVHAGAQGGWYRNIVFIPAYNREGKSPEQLQGAPAEEVAPYGNYWADWVSTSGEWINGSTAASSGGSYEYDYAVMHVKPERGGKSLEERVGAALPVDFSAPSATQVGTMGAWGYPQAPPFNGVQMFKCLDKPVRLSLTRTAPTMFRIGCTMTAGSSGGGWFHVKADKKTYLVSNTSIGPAGSSGWLAGPQLGKGAERMFQQMSRKYGSS